MASCLWLILWRWQKPNTPSSVAQIQGTTEDRASTPNSIIIVVQWSRKHKDKSTSLDKICCEKPSHHTKISFLKKPTKNGKKRCLLDNDPFLFYRLVLVPFVGGSKNPSFSVSATSWIHAMAQPGDEGCSQGGRFCKEKKNIGWIFAIEWQIHIKTSKGYPFSQNHGSRKPP